MYRKPTRARITYNCTHTSITKSRGNVTPDLHHVHTNRKPNPNNKLASRPDNIIIKPLTVDDLRIERFDAVNKEADAAMKRYKQYLKKEFKDAKSKQSQGEPV